jgi:hypothetical protein
MEHLEVFLVMAEVAAAFAGLSLLVTALRPSVRDDVFRHIMLRDVAQASLLVLGGVLGAYALSAFGLGPEITWRVSSGGIVAGALGSRHSTVSRVRAVAPGEIRDPIHLTGRYWPQLNLLLVALILLLLVWNVLLAGPRAEARYLVALLLVLVNSGVLFLSAAFVMPTPDTDA